MDKNELAKKWLQIAEEDFEMSIISLEKKKLLYAAYHLQQSMEKVLKGIFVSKELGQPPYMHDLTRIADAIKNAHPIDEKYYVFFSALNPFYIKARYPDYKEFIEKSLNLESIVEYQKIGKEVLQWLQILCK